MPRRKKAVWIEENWDKEIEEERKKRKEMTFVNFEMMLEKIKRRQDSETQSDKPWARCKHYKTFWWHEPYPMLLCKECYVILE